MSNMEQLLTELQEALTDDLHRRLVIAYRRSQTYEALLEVCVAEMEAKINEIEDTHSSGDKGFQSETND